METGEKSMVAVEDTNSILKDVGTIGITPKQIAQKTGEKEDTIKNHLEILREKGEITRIGRNLWILKIYEDITNDPKFISPDWYIQQFKNEHSSISFTKYKQKITFAENGGKRIHRWSPYIQGFSASFVEDVIDKYKLGKGDVVLDPFVGSGTVLVCAKMRGANSIGVDLMPLMTFMAKVKTTWDIDTSDVNKELDRIRQNRDIKEDGTLLPFLKETKRHFDEEILNDLLVLKRLILNTKNYKIRDLFLLAFASILVNCSNLKRSPCLGYVKDKKVSKDAPFRFFFEKVTQMMDDLSFVQQQDGDLGTVKIYTADAKKMTYSEPIDFAITSPPYVNGMDYVTNYKIEMAWLGIDSVQIRSYKDLRKLRDEMVSCDNISKQTVRDFTKQAQKYDDDDWLNRIVSDIHDRIVSKGNYRRSDMHLIVKKYFEDLWETFERVYGGLRDNGRFVIVIGDSLIAGTYIPTDLILARMGEKIGFSIEEIEVARERRSGQRRKFKLRESIVTLIKGEPRKKPKLLRDFFEHKSNLSG